MSYVAIRNGCVYQLIELSVEEMDRLRDNTKTFGLVGLPVYYDASGRVYPEPEPGVEVRKDPAP